MLFLRAYGFCFAFAFAFGNYLEGDAVRDPFIGKNKKNYNIYIYNIYLIGGSCFPFFSVANFRAASSSDLYTQGLAA